MYLQVIFIFFKGFVKGETKLASSALLPLLAKFLFSRIINCRSCLVPVGSCIIHSAIAHLGPPPCIPASRSYRVNPRQTVVFHCRRSLPMLAILAISNHPPPAPRLPPNFTQAHPIHPRISRGLHSVVASKPSIRGPRRARFWRAGVEGPPNSPKNRQRVTTYK